MTHIFKMSIYSVVGVLVACSNDEPKATDTTDTEATLAPLSEEGEWAQEYEHSMRELVNSSTQFEKLNELEVQVEMVEEQILKPWMNAWNNGDIESFNTLFADSAVSLDWANSTAEEQRRKSGIIESTVIIPTGNDSTQEYLDQFHKIQGLTLSVNHVEDQDDKMVFTVEYDFRAELDNGHRHQDRGHITVTTSKSSEMKIQSLAASEIDRLKTERVPAYVDKTTDWGLTGTLPIDDRKEAIRRGGYALVVADYDQDGKVDMLVGNYGPINLLRNTGDGFEDVTAQSGIDPEEVIKGAGFVDMDNDGDRDITMLRFTDSNDPRGDFVIYENNGDGTFTKHTDLLPRRRAYDTPMPLSMGDYNNDGWIDIYIGFPGVRDFTSGISTEERPEWQASQGIWFNQGNWNFVEADDDNAIVEDNETYSHAAASTDLDGDGWIDLLVVDDSGRINPVFHNNGSGNFEPLGEESGLAHAGLSMGVSTGDFNNDGLLDIMSSHVTMNAGKRLGYSAEGIVDDESGVGELMKLIRDTYVDLQLFTNNGDGTFTDVTSTANLNWAGEAAGAGEWLDYNHDGLLDYYLPNGLWSGGQKSLDSVFFRAELLLYGAAIMGEQQNDVELDLSNDVHGGAIFSKSDEGGSNPVLTLLRNHRAHGEAPLTYSFTGYQRNALFRNNGDGTFTEVAFLEGVDRIEDGYIVAPVDVDGDGLQDMVLRNTDPALEQSFQPVIALKNQLVANTLTVKLLSQSGNTDGLGARVTAYIGDTVISREIRSVSGAVQGEPSAYFGLGDSTRVDRIVVTWPGGEQQEMSNVDMGSVTITR